MDLMDVDFDGSDRVKDFLLSKFAEIEERCEALKRKCEERKGLCERKVAEHKFVNDDSVQVTLLRKRVFNKRFAFHFFVCNANESSLEKPNVKLTSKRFHRLSYMFKVYEELDDPSPCDSKNCPKFTDKLVLTDEIKKQCHMVIVLEIQQFQGSLEEEMEGSLCGIKNGKKVQATLPKIEISIDDCTNRFMSDWSSNPQDFQDVLTIMACNFSEELLLVLPASGWSDDLTKTFEIYCGFTAINLDSSCKQYYLIDKFSEIFQGCLIETHPAKGGIARLQLVTVYQKDPDSAVFFSHLIQKSIPGAQVFHRSHLNKYLMSHKLDCIGEERWELFRSHLLQEMDFVENQLKETEGIRDKASYVKFMNKLAALEKKTDEIFSEIYNNE